MDEHRLMSRRTMLAGLGMAGAAAMVIGPSIGMSGDSVQDATYERNHPMVPPPSHPLLTRTVMPVTIAMLRQLSKPESEMVYYVSDAGQEGPYMYDASDTMTMEDTGWTIVSQTGARFKRVREPGYANVQWFGAKGDGVTDDTDAFAAALGQGHVTVYVPAGTYRVSGLRIPSHTTLRGAGMERTILKLTDHAANGEWVITNQDYDQGNTHIVLEDFTADWNLSRANVSRVGNQASSCIALAHAHFCWIRRVKAVNSLLHCFDVTSPQYVYEGDTVYSDKPSRFVWIQDCIADGFEDDGFTTHHSEYIFIENCYATGASKAGMYPGASVGFEIDDGSRHVWVMNCISEGNVRGFMAKGHHDAPAAQDIHFTNCTSIRDTRSFELLHVLHHASTDPESPNAFDVTITNGVSFYPERKAISLEMTQRALSIAAYARVRVNGFTAIGDPAYDYKAQPVIAVQTKARYVILDQIQVTGFHTASTDINIAGGANSGNFFQISNVTVEESSPNGIFVGTGRQGVLLSNIHLHGRQAAGSVGLKYYSAGTQLQNIVVLGYDHTAYAPDGLILSEVIEVPVWQDVDLLNGWQEADAARSPRYTRNHQGFVHIYGAVHGTWSPAALFVLPASYRPKRSYTMLASGSAGGSWFPVQMQVHASGEVTAAAYATTSGTMTIELDGMVFPTDR